MYLEHCVHPHVSLPGTQAAVIFCQTFHSPPQIHPLSVNYHMSLFFFFPEKLTGCFSERVHQCFQKVHFIPSPSDAASWPQPCYKRWSDIPIFQEKGCTSSPSDFALKSKGAASTALCAEAVPVCCSLLVKSTK